VFPHTIHRLSPPGNGHDTSAFSSAKRSGLQPQSFEEEMFG
jgi:hypothetical protein